MLIQCQYDPNSLIDSIGNLYFMELIEEDLTNSEKLSDSAFIIDCEDGVKIEISSDYGKSFNVKAAESLIKLLNQDYKAVFPEILGYKNTN